MDNPTTQLDSFEVGQMVIARFTNSGRVYQFKGVIAGKTKNYWKVLSITPPYEGEELGREFRIETLASRRYSANNCIVRTV